MKRIGSSIVAIAATMLFVRTSEAVPYAQLSSSQNQVGAATPQVVTLNQIDAIKSITNSNGVIRFNETGAYFVMAAAQAGSADGKGKGHVRLWMRMNGKDVENSNTEQTIVPGFTAVLVCQGVGEIKAGDTLELVYSVSAATPTVGLIASNPSGEPSVPSLIFTAFKVDDSAFAQVSSSETQTAAAVGKRVTLNSVDAAKNIENNAGVLTVKNSGAYFVMAAGQVGGSAANGKGRVRLWLRHNGRDVTNSNCEQAITPGFTAVLVCQGMLELKAGDRVELMQAATGSGVGMVASAPKGEPVVPSLILSVVKVADDAYAQLSSVQTQPGASFGQLVTLNQTDASRNVQLGRGATMSISINKQTITTWQDGVYVVIAAGQVGSAHPKGAGSVRMWLRKNGMDVAKSNTEQTVTNNYTAVLVCQVVGEAKKGDRFQLFQSAHGSGVGLVASSPKGEPTVSSIIISLVKVD
jgi:hypothetical protein